ncbi:MAG: hypothetical protein IPG32_16395 [Saprospirales bacterium]|nr:hypothetical protein [Saprospirales bacterium]
MWRSGFTHDNCWTNFRKLWWTTRYRLIDLETYMTTVSVNVGGCFVKGTAITPRTG